MASARVLPRVAVALLLLTSFASSVPMRDHSGRSTHSSEEFDEKCSTSCIAGSKFQYRPGTTYNYKYSGSAMTQIRGTDHEQTGLQVDAQVQLTVVDGCEFALRLKSVSLRETQPNGQQAASGDSREFARALEANPLYFSFQDGTVKEVCPVGDDETWVLNFKRGVVSLLQNTQLELQKSGTFYEKDVNGQCDAEYQVQGQGTVKKTKNLVSCRNRHKLFSTLQSVPYYSNSRVQTVPIVNSTHECVQRVSREGVMDSVECEEEHVFVPFSNKNAAALTKTSQSLTSQGSSPGQVPQQSRRAAQCLLYHHEVSHVGEATAEVVLSTLQELCEESRNEITSKVPELFSELVGQVRELENDRDLQKVYREVDRMCRGNDKGKKFFLDAIVPAAKHSATAYKYAVDLLSRGTVRGLEAEGWLTFMSFINEPSLDMVEAAEELLTSRSLSATSAKAVFATTSLVKNYCAQ